MMDSPAARAVVPPPRLHTSPLIFDAIDAAAAGHGLRAVVAGFKDGEVMRIDAR